MTDPYPFIHHHFACKVLENIYFFCQYESPNSGYGSQSQGGWVVQIKIDDDSIASQEGFEYVLSPYVWDDPSGASDSTTPLYDSLSFRNTVDNGWKSESLGIVKLLVTPLFLAVTLPASFLNPTTGNLTYDIWVLSTEDGNPMQSTYKGPIISLPFW